MTPHTEERARMIAHLKKLAAHHEGPRGLGLNAAVALRAAAASLRARHDVAGDRDDAAMVCRLIEMCATRLGDGVVVREVLGKAQHAAAVRVRFAAIWCAQTVFGWNDPKAAAMFQRERTTIYAAFQRAEEMRRRDDEFRTATDEVVRLSV